MPVQHQIRHSLFNEDFEQEHDFQTILEHVAGLALNLEEVSLLHVLFLLYDYTAPKPPWPGLPSFVHSQTGSLNGLSVTGTVHRYKR